MIKTSLFMVVILGSLTVSCGRAMKKSPAGVRDNFKQAQSVTIPTGALTTVTQKNPAMIGGYTLDQAECKGVSGPDAGESFPINFLEDYREVVVVNDTDLTLAGGLGSCTYLIKLGLVGITDSSVYVQLAAFHAYENSVDITASLATNAACKGVIPNLSTATNTLQIDYTFDNASKKFTLDYPVSSGSYCGDGNREVDTYQGAS